MKLFGRVVKYLEDESRPIYYYVFTFLAAVTLRNLLEFIVSSSYIGLKWHHPIHFTLFYGSLCLWMILLLRFLTGEKVSRLARSVSTAFCITPLVPIADVLVQPLWHYTIQYQYLVPDRIENVWKVFFTFLGEYDGVTPAMRLEIFLVSLAAGVYVYLKKKSYFRAIFGGITAYSIIFWVFGAILYWIMGIEKLTGLPYDTTPRMMISVYVVMACLAFFPLAYYHRPRDFKEIVRDGRFSRVAHYELMAAAGILLGYPWGIETFGRMENFFEVFFLFSSIVFACIFSAITNNLEDLGIDKVSNPKRPSVSRKIPAKRYSFIAWMSLFLSLALGMAAGHVQLFLVCCFIGGYAIYSMPPVRLKRLTFFSKSIIALNSLALMLSGYTLTGREINTLNSKFYIFFLVAMTACANVIDLKDIKGDRAAGIKTLPVLLGVRWSKLLIGLFLLSSCSLFPVVFGIKGIFIYCALPGILLFLVVIRRKYTETPVFIIYLTGLSVLLVYLSTSGIAYLDKFR